MDISAYYNDRSFSDNLKAALVAANNIAGQFNYYYIGSETMIYAFLSMPMSKACKILNDFEITKENYYHVFRTNIRWNYGSLNDFTPELKDCFERAKRVALKMNSRAVYTEHLIFAIFGSEDDNKAKENLRSLGVSAEDVAHSCYEIIMEEARLFEEYEKAERAAKKSLEIKPNPIKTDSLFSEVDDLIESDYPTVPDELLKYGTDLTRKASEGRIDPVIGRKDEIEKVIQILSRRTKNNPVLIGEPGVGKSAVIEGLARAIVAGEVPEILQNKMVFSLDMGSLVAGTKYRGDFEERLSELVKTIKRDTQILLFIDEIHNLMGAGSGDGAMDAANILKPLLSRGELQTIGATTIEEYRKYIEKDAALERRFTPVTVNEPTVEDTITILKGIKSKYEAHHKVVITDDAIESAVNLAHRYINDRFFPDKAIDIIDEASAKARLNATKGVISVVELENKLNRLKEEYRRAKARGDGDREDEYERLIRIAQQEYSERKAAVDKEKMNMSVSIGKEEVMEIISGWTDIPLNKIGEEESEKLVNLERYLHDRIIGQDDAIRAVSNAIRRARSGLKDPNKPIGSFIFVGPTGVGKTDLTKALAYQLFGDENQIIRLDMSEFMEKHSVSKLIGAPPGYKGFDESSSGLLTERIRRKPYSVVLFDEIEKAHPDVFNVLLQILDDGRLSDNKGKVASFKNCVIIMTSNAGASAAATSNALGFSTSESKEQGDYEKMKENIEEALKNQFRPEFLNRFDEIIVFHKLSKAQAVEVCDKMLLSLVKRVREREMDLVVTNPAKKMLVDEGYNEAYGARPLRRVIQKRIEDRLSEEILKGSVKKGERVIVDVLNEKMYFRKEKIRS